MLKKIYKILLILVTPFVLLVMSMLFSNDNTNAGVFTLYLIAIVAVVKLLLRGRKAVKE